MLDQQEVIDLIDNFINENGLWKDFVKWLDEQGYDPEELGFPKDE